MENLGVALEIHIFEAYDFFELVKSTKKILVSKIKRELILLIKLISQITPFSLSLSPLLLSLIF
jgi:hypothetical protein